MFSLNEDNQFLLSSTPTDMRVGVNSMCGKVREAGFDPTCGKVFVFVGKGRRLMKLLHWERGGYALYYKRLESGRFSPTLFPSESGSSFRNIRWDELVLYVEGISPKTKRRKRFQTPEKVTDDNGKTLEKSWLFR